MNMHQKFSCIIRHKNKSRVDVLKANKLIGQECNLCPGVLRELNSRSHPSPAVRNGIDASVASLFSKSRAGWLRSWYTLVIGILWKQSAIEKAQENLVELRCMYVNLNHLENILRNVQRRQCIVAGGQKCERIQLPIRGGKNWLE